MITVRVIFFKSKYKRKTLKKFNQGRDFEELIDGLMLAIDYKNTYDGPHKLDNIHTVIHETVLKRPKIRAYPKRLTRRRTVNIN